MGLSRSAGDLVALELLWSCFHPHRLKVDTMCTKQAQSEWPNLGLLFREH